MFGEQLESNVHACNRGMAIEGVYLIELMLFEHKMCIS